MVVYSRAERTQSKNQFVTRIKLISDNGSFNLGCNVVLDKSTRLKDQ